MTRFKTKKGKELFSELLKKLESEIWKSLQQLLGYSDLRNFLNVVEKAKESCKNAGFSILNHFVDVTKMVPARSSS